MRILSRPRLNQLAVLFLLASTLLLASRPCSAADDQEQRDLVEKSRMTLDGFLTDSHMSWFHDHLPDAKGILIVPQLLKAAFFFGGEGGSGVLLVRDGKTGDWSQPAFYTMGAGSFGFQFGAQASEVILLVMTQKGVESLLSDTIKLGADAAIAVGPVGAGIEGSTALNLSADLLSFARTQGLFGGISLEGAVIATRDEWNRMYYGQPVRPTDILLKRSVSNQQSAALTQALAKAVGQTKDKDGPSPSPSPSNLMEHQ